MVNLPHESIDSFPKNPKTYHTKMSKPLLSIAIPCYRCEKQIPRLLRELDQSIENMQSFQLVSVRLIENHGNDDTCLRAQETIATLKNHSFFSVYRNQENYGLGGTHKIALDLALKEKATHLLILHGDHQAKPREIESLLSLSIKNDLCTVLGSRFQDQARLQSYSQIRRGGNLFLNGIYSVLTGKRITDLGSGLNLFSLSQVNKDDIFTMSNDFTFNMDYLLYLISKKIPFQYTPISWQTTDQVSNARSIEVGWITLVKVLRWKLGLGNKKGAFVYETKRL